MGKYSAKMFTGGATDRFGEREKDDFYATPPIATELFLDNFKLENCTALEPCCGMGHISKVIKQKCPTVKLTSYDLVDRGYGDGINDFLSDSFNDKFDIVITNPPYKLGREFVDKTLEIANDKVIMFMKIQFLEAESRKEWLKSTPLKYIYVNSGRMSCWKDGQPINPNTGKEWSGAMMLCWFVWEKGYKGEPIVRWL